MVSAGSGCSALQTVPAADARDAQDGARGRQAGSVRCGASKCCCLRPQIYEQLPSIPANVTMASSTEPIAQEQIGGESQSLPSASIRAWVCGAPICFALPYQRRAFCLSGVAAPANQLFRVAGS